MAPCVAGTTWTWDGRGTPFPSNTLDYQLYGPQGLEMRSGLILDTEGLTAEKRELEIEERRGGPIEDREGAPLSHQQRRGVESKRHNGAVVIMVGKGVLLAVTGAFSKMRKFSGICLLWCK